MAAARSVFGGTIAHGFLTLSMISLMAVQALPAIAGGVMEVNYGFNRIRFLTPVRSGSRVRGSFVLMGLEERNPGEWLARYDVTIEICGEPKPALVCPCHYSTFDPATGGTVIFGPAGRKLPMLPLQIDRRGYLRAAGTFDGPVGPSWWGVRNRGAKA